MRGRSLSDKKIINNRGQTTIFAVLPAPTLRKWPEESSARIISTMSPTIFREGGFRFYFFSREEPRMHVHVQGQNGEAKFWLEPAIEVAQHTGLSRREISEAQRLVQEHENDIRSAWHRHFPG
jgi:hypothetical protein